MQPMESRRYPRSDVPLIISYYSEENSEERKGMAKDLSANGISFETDTTYEKDDILKLKMVLENLNKTIEASGRVVRSEVFEDKSVTAVELFNVDYEDFITILDYSLAYYKK
ncbi:MAG: PilZ domain-containing protein [Spirochaetia bacterium]|nr:PilZ domain-containing protein [Spirochaetia bacterium]